MESGVSGKACFRSAQENHDVGLKQKSISDLVCMLNFVFHKEEFNTDAAPCGLSLLAEIWNAVLVFLRVEHCFA